MSAARPRESARRRGARHAGAAASACAPAPLRGFAPIAGPDACVLVLGSMPGEASLRLRQYYGHPHNAFWKIMGELLGFDATLDYAQRAAALVRHRVALWDVLVACRRTGSLDASIEPASIVPNDFADFLATHPLIGRICFNGAMAERLFRRHVATQLALDGAVAQLRLPSTSPAHAGMSYARKLRAWRVVVPG